MKAGSVIPQAPLTQFIADGPSRPELILTAYRGPASTFWLYEDDGITRDHESGAFVTSKIERWREGKSEWVRIYPPEGSYPGSERRRHLTFKVYGYKKTNLKSCRIDQERPIDCNFADGAIVAEVDWDSTHKGEALTFVVDLK